MCKYLYHTIISPSKIYNAVEQSLSKIDSNYIEFSDKKLIEKMKNKKIFKSFKEKDMFVIQILFELISWQYELYNHLKYPVTKNEEIDKTNKKIVVDKVIKYTTPVINNIISVDCVIFEPVWNKLGRCFTLN